MENDLTLLYYTSNRIPQDMGDKIRYHLLNVTEGKFPLVSVSQKPMFFGNNICVGDIGVSKYNIYKQIYTGVKAVKTKYVACCEDDTLYNLGHFLYRPERDVFAYDTNMWFAESDEYWRRPKEKERAGMFGCITETAALHNLMKMRFDKYPQPDPDNYWWGEPGFSDKKLLGIRPKVEYFHSSAVPLIVFLRPLLKEERKRNWKKHRRESPPENHVQSVEQYGEIKALCAMYL